MLLLYDGTCLMCNRLIRGLLDMDKDDNIRAAALQHYLGSEIQEVLPIDKQIDSIVLIKDHQVYYKSTAALQAAKGTNSWSWLYKLALLLPAFVRDGVYDFIATNRYKWFGKSDQCIPPPIELRHKYLLEPEELTTFFMSHV